MTKLVLSLFARAQDQYLFPGSIENPNKHVLTDRGLVKWWCQVLDPVLSKYPNAHQQSVPGTEPTRNGAASHTSQGFLRVPGCDLYETRAFFPSQSHKPPLSSRRWKVSDPLRQLGKSETLPESCLIPRFPDDPKARFVDELDDELPVPPPETSTSSSEDQNLGRWRSVRSLEEFWEMMAFRQECSAGRLVGFLWGLFVPIQLSQGAEVIVESSQGLTVSKSEADGAALSPPSQSHGSENTIPGTGSAPIICADSLTPPPSLLPSEAERSSPNHVPSVESCTLKPETEDRPSSSTPVCEPRKSREQLETTKYYHWPKAGRGAVVLREKDYRRVGKLLIHLDYADEKIAAESTERWIREVGTASGDLKWGTVVHGRRQTPVVNHAIDKSGASMLDIGLMRKKRRVNDDDDVDHPMKQTNGTANNKVNVLSVGHIRKKPKEV